MSFKVNLKRGSGFTDAQWEQHLEAAYWWARCWNDPGFQKQVLTYEKNVTTCTGFLWWKKCQTRLVQGFAYTVSTRDQILAQMLSGSEVLLPEMDQEADVEVIVGNQRGVVGWTYPDTLTQWVSRWFIASASIAELAGNRAHEYMHKLGYDHPFRSTSDRPRSVPYAIGALTEAWVKTNYNRQDFHNS